MCLCKGCSHVYGAAAAGATWLVDSTMGRCCRAAGQVGAFKRQGLYQHVQAQNSCMTVLASEDAQHGTAKVLLEGPLTRDQMQAFVSRAHAVL